MPGFRINPDYEEALKPVITYIWGQAERILTARVAPRLEDYETNKTVLSSRSHVCVGNLGVVSDLPDS